jgi:murein DD-endopeptidase MepM/ murein hydrolase activator NlpD
MKKLMFMMLVLVAAEVRAELYTVGVGSLNLRSEPNYRNDKNIIDSLGEGTQLEFLEEAGDYVKVRVRDGQTQAGKTGYVWKDHIEALTGYDGINEGNDAVNAGQPQMPLCAMSTFRISSGYGMRTHPITKRRRLHSGCDLAVPKGSLVRAAAAGKVKRAGRNGGYGNTIDIEHKGELKDLKGVVRSSRGYTTRYAHLWKILVKAGQSVEKGQVIGKVDSTGSSTGHHLHFEIALPYKNRQNTGGRVDPKQFVNLQDGKAACPDNSSRPTSVSQ